MAQEPVNDVTQWLARRELCAETVREETVREETVREEINLTR